MRNGNKMKNKKYGVLFVIALLCALLYFACDTVVDMPKIQTPIENGYGRISITLTEEEAARTVLPSMSFTHYEYTFTKTGESSGTVKVPDNDGSFIMEVDNYTVTVQAYTGTEEAYTLAAIGTSAQFSVESGKNVTIKVPLSGVTVAEQGKLNYTITYPEGATATITLQKWPEMNTIILNPSNITNGKTQTLEIGAGSYMLSVLISKDNLYAGISEAIHIYSSLTTEYTKNFVDDDMLALIPPLISDYNISGIGTFVYDGKAKTVSVTPKAGASPGAITVYYTGTDNTTSTNAPVNTGTYTVTFDVAATTEFSAETLTAGTLTIAVLPSAPQNFTATPGNAQVVLSWTAPSSNGGSPITGYQVSSNNGSTWVTASTNTSHTFTGLTNGISYTFQVRAVSGAGNGATVSTTATPITTPSAPQNFIATPGNLKTALLWTAPSSDGGSPITDYQVSSDNGSSWVKASGNTSHTFTGLTNGASYTFRVRAINAVGNGASASITATPGLQHAAQWARSVSAGYYSEIHAVAVDSSGNVYVAGFQSGTGTYNYGNGVSVAGSAYDNAVLVKYNSSGTAQWARSVSAGSDSTFFDSVAVDSSGNVYAAGNQVGTSTYTYGTGVSVAGAYSGANAVLVKYNSDGTAQWARSVSAGSDSSYFNSLVVDSSGNVYAAGFQSGTGTYTYGNGVSVAGSAYDNAVLVKYNSSGVAQWAHSVSAGSDSSLFYSVAVDSSGNVYAAGSQSGTGTYNYGNGVSVAGSAYDNAVLVKYNSSGTAQWARSVSAGNNGSRFNSLVVDSSGNVYAAGYQRGTGTYTYGNGVSVAGTAGTTGTTGYYYDNVVLVKYNSSGTAQWARSVSAGSNDSRFYSVAVDSSGNVYAAGNQGGTSYNYGNGVSVAAISNSSCNVVLVKYNSAGEAQLARSVSAGSDDSRFFSVAVDSSGNVYAAGYQRGTGTYNYSTEASVAGIGSYNVVLVKYVEQ